MSIVIRKATAADLDAVSHIYDRIHDEEEAGRASTGWTRGVYPVRATAEAALARGDLFVEELDGGIVGTAILNQIQVDVYADTPWQFAAPDEGVMVLHTLVIDPGKSGAGLGRAFAAYYEDYARAAGCTVLRIDTNAKNAAARSLYRKLGYREAAILPCTFNGISGVDLVMLEKAL